MRPTSSNGVDRPGCWRGALLSFVMLRYGYSWLCLNVGYVMAGEFLAGLLPAAPVAVIAAYARRWWLAWPAEGMAFVVYFWVSGLLPGWKDQVLG